MQTAQRVYNSSSLPDDARQVFSRQQLVDLRAGARGDIDVDHLLAAPDEAPNLRRFRDRFEYRAVAVQGGRAAFLRLGLHVFHFSSSCACVVRSMWYNGFTGGFFNTVYFLYVKPNTSIFGFQCPYLYINRANTHANLRITSRPRKKA